MVPLNSTILPVTVTTSPTFTAGLELVPVNTMMPSEVSGLPSPTGSWITKPLDFFAVTTLPTVV